MQHSLRQVLAGLVATLIAALALAGCGSKEDPKAVAARQAIAPIVLADTTGGSLVGFTYDQAAADCFAAKVVDGVGLPDLVLAGIVTQDGAGTGKHLNDWRLPTRAATVTAGALLDCSKNNSFITKMQTTLTAKLPAGTTKAQRACLQGKVTRALVLPVLASGFDGQQQPAGTALLNGIKAAIKSCGITSIK